MAATLPASQQPAVSVSVSVTFQVDEKGGAHITDVKTLKNHGPGNVIFHNEYVQAIRDSAVHIKATDSRGVSYKARILRGGDFHQVAVEVGTPSGHSFEIPEGEERSLTIEYDVPDFASVLVGGSDPTYLITNRYGASTFAFPFGNLEYNLRYEISKVSAPQWWQRFSWNLVLKTDPPGMKQWQDRKRFYVTHSLNCEPKSVRYIHILMTFQERSSIKAFALGVASSTLVAAAPLLAAVIQRLFK